MAPSITLLKRDTSHLSDGAWIGIGISVGLVGILCFVLAIRIIRRDIRRHKEWVEPKLPPFVMADHQPPRGHSQQESVLTVMGTTTFSRAKLQAGIVTPARALTRGSTPSDAQVLAHHQQTNKLPRPFSVVSSPPFSNLVPVTPPPSSEKDEFPELPTPTSFLSPMNNNTNPRSSIISVSSLSSLGPTPSKTPIQRKVRQIFRPLLADELLLSVGETLTIVQSYADGWCVVARDSFSSASGEIEMGTVPAWCFSKPIKGLKMERPKRVQSIGVYVSVWRREREGAMDFSNA